MIVTSSPFSAPVGHFSDVVRLRHAAPDRPRDLDLSIDGARLHLTGALGEVASEVPLLNLREIAPGAESIDQSGDDVVDGRRPFAVRPEIVLVKRCGFIERDQRLLPPATVESNLGAKLGLVAVRVPLGLAVRGAVEPLPLQNEVIDVDAAAFGQVGAHPPSPCWRA
jgi:hypothetical protein